MGITYHKGGKTPPPSKPLFSNMVMDHLSPPLGGCEAAVVAVGKHGRYACPPQPPIKTLNDKWTVITQDGKLSAQWEHTIVVMKDGIEILTDRDF